MISGVSQNNLGAKKACTHPDTERYDGQQSSSRWSPIEWGDGRYRRTLSLDPDSLDRCHVEGPIIEARGVLSQSQTDKPVALPMMSHERKTVAK